MEPSLARGLLGAPTDERSEAEDDAEQHQKKGARDCETPPILQAWGKQLQRSESQAAFPHAGPPLSVGQRSTGREVDALRIDGGIGFMHAPREHFARFGPTT